MHQHAGIGQDDHFIEKGIMVSIPACRYKAGYAFSPQFSSISYTFSIIQKGLTVKFFPFKSIVRMIKLIRKSLLIQNWYNYH